jgi:uncharacterized repeat protein (TIGR04042 family)
MPEMHFTIQWPSGAQERCYSPSYIIEEYLGVGAEYSIEEFLSRTRSALTVASDRVRERYGFACSSALDQVAALEQASEQLSPDQRNGTVKVLAFEKHPPRDARAQREAPK